MDVIILIVSQLFKAHVHVMVEIIVIQMLHANIMDVSSNMLPVVDMVVIVIREYAVRIVLDMVLVGNV